MLGKVWFDQSTLTWLGLVWFGLVWFEDSLFSWFPKKKKGKKGFMLGVVFIWTCTSIHHNHILLPPKKEKKKLLYLTAHIHLEYRFL